jgi:hypothetical protein
MRTFGASRALARRATAQLKAHNRRLASILQEVVRGTEVLKASRPAIRGAIGTSGALRTAAPSLKRMSTGGRQLRSAWRYRRLAADFTLPGMKQSPAHLAG